MQLLGYLKWLVECWYVVAKLLRVVVGAFDEVTSNVSYKVKCMACKYII